MGEVLLMGVGGAGMDITKHVKQQLGHRAIAVSTNADALKRSGFQNTLRLGTTVNKGVPARLPSAAARAAEQSRDELLLAVTGYSTLVVIAGLGRGTGTGATPVIIELASALNIRVIAAVVLPFEFEGTHRDAALEALPGLRSTVDQLLVYDNAASLQDTTTKTMSLTDYFAAQAVNVSDGIGKCLSAYPGQDEHLGPG